MSYRGSFVTEYIYCDKCFDAIKPILLSRDRDFCSTILPGWSEKTKELPIIAGKISGLYPAEELDIFDGEFREKIEAVICHPIYIAVLAESDFRGKQILKFNPKGISS